MVMRENIGNLIISVNRFLSMIKLADVMEPLPAMVKKIIPWTESIYCGEILEEINKVLNREKQKNYLVSLVKDEQLSLLKNFNINDILSRSSFIIRLPKFIKGEQVTLSNVDKSIYVDIEKQNDKYNFLLRISHGNINVNIDEKAIDRTNAERILGENKSNIMTVLNDFHQAASSFKDLERLQKYNLEKIKAFCLSKIRATDNNPQYFNIDITDSKYIIDGAAKLNKNIKKVKVQLLYNEQDVKDLEETFSFKFRGAFVLGNIGVEKEGIVDIKWRIEKNVPELYIVGVLPSVHELSISLLKNRINNLKLTIKHEIVHLTQLIFRKKIEGEGPEENIHYLKPIEYDTWLMESVEVFNELLNSIRPMSRRIAIKPILANYFVGNMGYGELPHSIRREFKDKWSEDVVMYSLDDWMNYLEEQRGFFIALKTNKPDIWKKAKSSFSEHILGDETIL